VAARPSLIGAPVARIEDDRLLTGTGAYAADLRSVDALEMAIVRSISPHAKIAVDLGGVRERGGVAAAYAAADLDGLEPVPDFVGWANPVRLFPLARDVVRYVGAPVAAVIADDRYTAEDAAEEVGVAYDELPAITSVADALADGAARLYDDWPDNRVVHVPPTDAATDDARRAFDRAHRVVGGSFSMGRHTAIPIEPRACLAEFRDGRLTLWSSTQIPHVARTMLSMILPLRESELRVIAGDVGGSFGIKAQVYPEEVLACWAAMRLGRPVRYVEDRAEHLVATGHARDTTFDLEAALDEGGHVLAVRGEIRQDVGSGEIFPIGFNPAFVAWGALTGSYRIAAQAIGVTCVVTNKTPSGAYRGFGIPEASFAMERLLDLAAAELALDPVEIRRRNLLVPEDHPFVSPSGAELDPGSHLVAFDRAVELGRRAAADHRAGTDRRVGVGFSNYLEGTGASYFGNTGYWADHDAVAMRFDPDGSVTVSSGVTTTGQGVPTMLATLAAETLHLPRERIRVVIGDTARTPYGLGAFASRSTGVAGGAMLEAGGRLLEKGRRIAAHLLETAPEDVELVEGGFGVVGTDRRVDWRAVATSALVRVVDLPPGEDPGLEAMATWRARGFDHEPRPDGLMNACPAYANGSQAAVVEVDVDTGEVRLISLIEVHDCGTVINPPIVAGQVHGGVAQGIAGALLEDLPYSAEGQPMATTFMDYLVPTTMEIPPLLVEHIETPSPTMPFGAKGAGEAGVSGTAAAIAQAIEDAVPELGLGAIGATPIAPAALLRSIRAARIDREPTHG
jgi:aerobic carbon-monoxide dehydrogenase large subunit